MDPLINPLEENGAPQNPEAETPETPKEPEQPDIAALIGTLSEQIQAVGTRLDDFDTRLGELNKKPEEPEGDQPGFQPKSWDDIPKLVEEKGAEVAQRIIEEREAQVKAVAEEEEKARQAIDQAVDEALAEQEKSGLVPAIKNAEDDNDPGRVYRRELFSYMAMSETVNIPRAVQVINTMHEEGRQFDHKTGQFLKVRSTQDSATVPISGGNNAGNGKTGLSYKDIHNLPFDQLAKRAMNQ